jgi:hypothetical protein
MVTKWKAPDQIQPDYATGVTGGADVGARWLFTQNFGIYIDLGKLISVSATLLSI